MLEIWAIKRLGQTFGWFLQLGAADAKQMRDELQDLLDHCSQSIKALASSLSRCTKSGRTRFPRIRSGRFSCTAYRISRAPRPQDGRAAIARTSTATYRGVQGGENPPQR